MLILKVIESYYYYSFSYKRFSFYVLQPFNYVWTSWTTNV